VPLQRVTYQFTKPLAAPRDRAYAWATDYRPSDFRIARFSGTRQVDWLAENLVLLTDTFREDPFNATRGAPTVKVKLVHLYPTRWSWTATHLSGPARYSQFLYRLSAHGPAASALHFMGSQVEEVDHAPDRAALLARGRELRREDSGLWDRLSAALAKELAKPGRDYASS
jgi:hypothetical protein